MTSNPLDFAEAEAIVRPRSDKPDYFHPSGGQQEN